MKQERRHHREQRGSAGARRNEPWEIRMRAGIAPRCWARCRARSACRRCRPTHAPRCWARSRRRCRPTHAPHCRARSACRLSSDPRARRRSNNKSTSAADRHTDIFSGQQRTSGSAGHGALRRVLLALPVYKVLAAVALRCLIDPRWLSLSTQCSVLLLELGTLRALPCFPFQTPQV